jgi:hypothetical protein
MLTYAAAQAENNLDCVGYRDADNLAVAAHWLGVIADLGCPLSEIEQRIATLARPQVEGGAVAAAATDEADID